MSYKKQVPSIQQHDLDYQRDDASRLGEGGFGVVYKGKWKSGNIDVAIKALKGAALTPKLKAELLQEASVHSTLRHPNVVLLYGAVTDAEPHCMVMELLGGSLYRLIHDEQEMAWGKRMRIAREIGVGLSYLHSKGIIHRDLKSLNVLLSSVEHQVKLSDFGLAQIKQASSMSTTGAGSTTGTIPWMAPELFKRRPSFTEQSDIYSYAVTLWEIASRAIPFSDAASPQLVIGWVKDGDREDIPQDTPPEISEVIIGCWSQLPEQRLALASVLDKLQGLLPTAPQPSVALPGNIPATFADNLMSKQTATQAFGFSTFADNLQTSLDSLASSGSVNQPGMLPPKSRSRRPLKAPPAIPLTAEVKYKEGLALMHKGQYPRAIDYFKEAATEGYPPALLRLQQLCGTRYNLRFPIGDDCAKLIRFKAWFDTQANTNKTPETALNMALYYYVTAFDKNTLHSNFPTIMQWLKLYGAQVGEEAKFLIAKLNVMQHGIGALSELEKLAQQGNVLAAIELGQIYNLNKIQAVRKNVNSRDVGIFHSYLEAVQVKTNQQTAITWFEQVANREHIESLLALEEIYRNQHDLFKSVNYFQRILRQFANEKTPALPVEFSVYSKAGLANQISEQESEKIKANISLDLVIKQIESTSASIQKPIQLLPATGAQLEQAIQYYQHAMEKYWWPAEFNRTQKLLEQAAALKYPPAFLRLIEFHLGQSHPEQPLSYNNYLYDHSTVCFYHQVGLMNAGLRWEFCWLFTGHNINLALEKANKYFQQAMSYYDWFLRQARSGEANALFDFSCVNGGNSNLRKYAAQKGHIAAQITCGYYSVALSKNIPLALRLNAEKLYTELTSLSPPVSGSGQLGREHNEFETNFEKFICDSLIKSARQGDPCALMMLIPAVYMPLDSDGGYNDRRPKRELHTSLNEQLLKKINPEEIEEIINSYFKNANSQLSAIGLLKIGRYYFDQAGKLTGQKFYGRGEEICVVPCPSDFDKAFIFLHRAYELSVEVSWTNTLLAEQNKYLLALCYENGWGTQQDYAKAWEIYEKFGVKCGTQKARCLKALGYEYLKGKNRRKDKAEAERCFKQAIELALNAYGENGKSSSYPSGVVLVFQADLYINGYGVKRNTQLGNSLLNSTDNLRTPKAILDLAQYCEKKRDFKNARLAYNANIRSISDCDIIHQHEYEIAKQEIVDAKAKFNRKHPEKR